MKKYFLILLICCTGHHLFAQPVTRRDDRYMKENALLNLLNSYEMSLNVITAGEAFPNEIKAHIERIINGSANEKIFFDDKVRIENDLSPGADQMKTKEDKIIRDYLEDLISLYKNPEANTIVFDKNYKISPLKKTAYFYYNVIFNSTFKGVNIDNKSYHTVGRVAEVRLMNDGSKWYPYINGIRFYNEPEYNPATDSLNVYTDFPASIGDNEDYISYLSKLNAEKSRIFEERDKEVRMLLEESQRRMEEGDVTKADSLLSRAWVVNPTDRMVVAARTSFKTEKEKILKERKERDERFAGINDLKSKAVDAYYSYDFATAKQMIDSLHFKYNEKKDTTIEQINNDLALLHTNLDPIQNAISTARYKDALKYCDAILKKEGKDPMTVECYYQKAVTLMKMDSLDNISKVYENLNTAVDISKKKHAKALFLRAALKKNQKKYDESLSDASYLVNTHSDNPKFYALRASIFDAEGRKADALSDYAMAIRLNTVNPADYANKARLEFEKNQYDDVIKTVSDALVRIDGSGDVYYYRALAYERTGDLASSGKDFSAAKRLRLDSAKTAAFRTTAKSYYNTGKTSFDKSNFKSSVDELSKALLLDTTADALFYLGKALENDNQTDKAEEVLTLLIAAYPDYSSAYYERGVVRRMNNKPDEAVKDFGTEYERFHSKQALLEKIKTEMLLGKYDDAAKDADNAARLFSDGATYQYAAESYYKIKNYDKVIQVFGLANQSSVIDYYYARTWYDKGDSKKAKTFFDKALELNKDNADAAYWSGAILYQAGKYEDALIPFRQAGSSAEYGTEAIFLRAMCHIRLKEPSGYKDAAKDLEIISNTKQYKNSETRSWQAYCQLYLNNDNGALSFLKEAKALDSANTIFSYVSACYYSKLHDSEQALYYLEKALAPGSKFAKYEIEKEFYFEELRDKKGAKDTYKKLLKTHFN